MNDCEHRMQYESNLMAQDDDCVCVCARERVNLLMLCVCARNSRNDYALWRTLFFAARGRGRVNSCLFCVCQIRKALTFYSVKKGIILASQLKFV